MASHFKIVVPFYNVEKWIKICIRSIKAQDYKDFQCILLDDMSTDNTAKIVREEIGNDPRFTFVEVQEKAFALKNIYDGIALLNLYIILLLIFLKKIKKVILTSCILW